MLSKVDWVKGDLNGIDFPADKHALEAGGTEFLTQAFQLMGQLDSDNQVVSITQIKEVNSGSTGCKLLLSITYKHNSRFLHNDLFVKFSRDFSSPTRDAAKMQMELEVKFAILSRDPNFPITVPICYFADFHQETGTGILITQCIPYECFGIEKQYLKAMDYQMPDQIGHYRALIKSLARIAAIHKAGLLSDSVTQYFTFEPDKLDVGMRTLFTPEQVSDNVSNLKVFIEHYPNLFPSQLRSNKLLSRLADEAPRFQRQVAKVASILQSRPELIALCHWNAHVDNAWFWRADRHQLECGLMDWGNVSQMNLAMAIWGCLSAAELSIWNDHLDELLMLFISEFTNSGGGNLSITELKRHLVIYVAKMGITWLLDLPLLTFSKIVGLSEIKSRFDPRIENNERARAQLTIMSAFLNLWEQTDMEAIIDYMEIFSISN